MERKIGEIFEYKGEWYQCIKGLGCNECDLSKITCYHRFESGSCSPNMRKDGTQVIFKKLEKVGEPYADYCPSGRIIYFQRYKIFNKSYSHNTEYIMCDFNEDGIVSIEIEQNKEDMEESVEEKLFCDKVAKANAEYMKVKLNSSLKPFDLEAAREGKPVCTRDGRKARIICFDAKGDKPIIALVEMGVAETPNNYPIDGKAISTKETPCDLMMLPEKKEGWVNVYKGNMYDTESEAKKAHVENGYIDTIKIEWEE